MQRRSYNNNPAARSVNNAGRPVNRGNSVARTHEHASGRLVTDSPPHVSTVCPAVRKDGQPCVQQKLNGKDYCIGHMRANHDAA